MFDLLGFLALTIDINTWYCCILSMGSENCWRPEVSTSSPASSVMSCLNKTTFFFLNFLQACLGCGETDLEGSDSGSEEYYSSCSVSGLPWDLMGWIFLGGLLRRTLQLSIDFLLLHLPVPHLLVLHCLFLHLPQSEVPHLFWEDLLQWGLKGFFFLTNSLPSVTCVIFCICPSGWMVINFKGWWCSCCCHYCSLC